MKKVLICLFLMSFLLIGCGNETSNNGEVNNGNSGSQEKGNNSTLGVGKYRVEKGPDSVSVITNDGSGISTTTYYFTAGKVTSAKMVEKFSSATIAQTSYNVMKNEPSIMNQYSDITLDGTSIVLIVKDSILLAYTGFGYDEFYNLMHDTYKVYFE